MQVEGFLLSKAKLEHGTKFFNHAKNSFKEKGREVFLCFWVMFFNSNMKKDCFSKEKETAQLLFT